MSQTTLERKVVKRNTIEAQAFLSRITAPPEVIENDYMAHRVFWRAFGLTPESAGQVQPFRFRKEGADTGQGLCNYLVQSAQEPAWEGVQGIQAECKRISLALESGQQMAFRLLANVQKHDTATDRKVAVTEPSKLIEWLTRQGEKHGFSILDAETRRPPSDVHSAYEKGTAGRAHNDRPRHVFRLNRIQFDGVLQIEDPALMIDAMVKGIGAKAAFGCGLLTVTR